MVKLKSNIGQQDIADSLTMTNDKSRIQIKLTRQSTLHTSPSPMSYEVSFAIILEKKYYVINRFHCNDVYAYIKSIEAHMKALEQTSVTPVY